eukprot:scaffold113000_cov57-Phaeocystis_antarctica.AAC.2
MGVGASLAPQLALARLAAESRRSRWGSCLRAPGCCPCGPRRGCAGRRARRASGASRCNPTGPRVRRGRGAPQCGAPLQHGPAQTLRERPTVPAAPVAHCRASTGKGAAAGARKGAGA